MEQLLKDFWQAYKRWQRIVDDMSTYPSGYTSANERDRAKVDVNNLARQIIEAERVAAKAPAVAYEDVPGQTYFGDLPRHMPAPGAESAAA